MIQKRGGKFVLMSKSSGKVLGKHASKSGAMRQERAIMAAKHAMLKPKTKRR